MSEPFEILFDFLQGFEPEVSARGAAPVPEEVRERMRLFGQGKLGASEQRELLHMLERQPEWISDLAAEVKALRPREDEKAAE